MESSFRERMLHEALQERERILDQVRDQLKEVDAIILSLNGEIPTEEIHFPPGLTKVQFAPPPPPVETHPPVRREPEPEPPPAPPEEHAPPERVSPSVAARVVERDAAIVAYLQEHGPTPRSDIAKALDIPKGSWGTVEPRLEREGRIVKFRIPSKRGPELLAYRLPDQEIPESLTRPHERSFPPHQRELPPGYVQVETKGKPPAGSVWPERAELMSRWMAHNGGAPISTNNLLKLNPEWTTFASTLSNMMPRLAQRTGEFDEETGSPIVHLTTAGKNWKPRGGFPAHLEPVKVRHEDPENLRKPPEPEPEQPVRDPVRGADFGGPERFPRLLRYMPSADTNMADKVLRPVLDRERKVLMLLDQDGPTLSVELADKLVGRENKTPMNAISKVLRKAAETGHVRLTGETDHAWWQREAKARGEAHVGRTSQFYEITDRGRAALRGEPYGDEEPKGKEAERSEAETATEPQVERSTRTITQAPSSETQSMQLGPPTPAEEDSEPGEGLKETPRLLAMRKAPVPTYELVRDAWTLFPGQMFSPEQLVKELGVTWPIAIVKAFLDQGLKEGRLTDKSPAPDLSLYQYDPPTGPGKAAEIDMERRSADEYMGGDLATPGRGEAVAGTAKQPVPPHADAAALVRDIRSAGGTAQPAGSGHWKVVNPVNKQSVRISGTPGSARSVKNDRKRVKRIGLNV